MTFVNPNNSQSRPDGNYKEVLEKIGKDRVCPFCSEHLTKYHKKPIIEARYWWITDNMYPYSPTLNHILIIHKVHISHANEIATEAWTELLDIIKNISKEKSVNGGTFIMRFGETKYTGGSVSHLHAHITQSNPDDKTYDQKKGLIMRIG